MKIKEILNLFCLTVIAFLALGCEKDPAGNGGTGETYDFTLKVESVSYDSAEISVQHNGPKDATWYLFTTKETKKSDFTILTEKLAELKRSGKVSLKRSNNILVPITDLENETEYKVFVIAMNKNCELNMSFNMASATFKTEESKFLLTECDDWAVEYKGRNRASNVESYKVAFNKNNAARCHVGFISKALVELNEADEDIQKEIEEKGGLSIKLGDDTFLFSVLDYLVFMELYEYWGYYYEDEAYFSSETFNTSADFDLPFRQASGEYYAVAMGFTDNETPTFTYSVSEVAIEAETPTEEYSKWIGSWNITGANDISYTLEFKEGDPNFYYTVSGWEHGSEHDDDCEEDCTEHLLGLDFSKWPYTAPFYFNALTKELEVKSSLMDSKIDEENSTSSEPHYTNWGLYGYADYEESLAPITIEDEVIATASTPENGQATLTGCPSIAYDENENKIDFTYSALGYLQYRTIDNLSSTWNTPVKLPVSMTKTTNAPQQASCTPAKTQRPVIQRHFAGR